MINDNNTFIKNVVETIRKKMKFSDFFGIFWDFSDFFLIFLVPTGQLLDNFGQLLDNFIGTFQ
jgi:hypothetical protein